MDIFVLRIALQRKMVINDRWLEKSEKGQKALTSLN